MPVKRSRTRAAAAAIIATALTGATVALAEDASGPGGSAHAARAASAKATAYARDNGDGNRSGLVTVSGTGSRQGRGTAVQASTANYKGSADASATVEDVTLLGGAVTADVASVRANASGGASSTGGRVRNLVVSGEAKGSPRSRASYPVEGLGRLTVLDDSGSGIVGMKVRLSRQYGSYPEGTTIRVAYASASARDGAAPKPRPAPKPDEKPSKPKASKPKTSKPDDSEPGADAKPDEKKPAKRRKPPRTRALMTNRGYVFPVYGKHTYSNDWHAARQDTGIHVGNDIFAEAGTPVVAVCDGTLHRVGTNTIPGNRLYLKCAHNDEFFYGHLSAFASDARSGLKVKAGKVIGFVGSTGDAEQTPPHLHFEVHPDSGEPVNPYPFLRAWETHRDVPAAAWVRENGSAGEQPGSLVVEKDFLSD